jgi:hypothetical protein
LRQNQNRRGQNYGSISHLIRVHNVGFSKSAIPVYAIFTQKLLFDHPVLPHEVSYSCPFSHHEYIWGSGVAVMFIHKL